MKRLICLLVLCCLTGCAIGDRTALEATALNAANQHRIEAGCAMCIYQMPQIDECVLAVKWNDRAYLVDGSGIDDHGDAHAPDGLCLVGRPGAMTLDSIQDGRLQVASLQLVPQTEGAE